MTIKNLGETNLGNLTTARNAEQLIAPVVGSGMPATPHSILSTTHSDTLAAAILRGDLLVGNATPKLSRLAVGTAGTILRSNGTDAAWASLATAGIVGGTGIASRLAYWSDENTTTADNRIECDGTYLAVYSNTVARNTLLALVGYGGSVPTLAQDAYGATQSAQWVLARYRGTLGAPEAAQNNDFMGTIYASAYDGAAVRQSVAIKLLVGGTVSSGVVPGQIYIQTANTSGTLTTALYISAAQNVGVGNTAPGARLHVTGAASAITAILRANATTPGNILEAQNSAGTVLASVTGAGILDTNGRRQAVTIKAINYTLLTTDEVVVFTATATATLPAATGTGQTYRIVCRAGTLTIDGNGSETVKGELTQSLSAGEDLILTDTAAGIWE